MKIIKYFGIVLIGWVMVAVFAYIGVNVGASFGTPGFPLDGAIFGFLCGLGIGIPIAIAAVKFFADYIWTGERKQNGLTTGEPEKQQEWKGEWDDPEAERQRVEKYGKKVVICSSCGTRNSMSFSRCLKCSKDLSREKPVDNPYI